MLPIYEKEYKPFDAVGRSVIMYAVDPRTDQNLMSAKTLRVEESGNPHVPDKVIGYLGDGTKVAIAVRTGGNGGNEINKIAKMSVVRLDGFMVSYDTSAGGGAKDKTPVMHGDAIFATTSGAYMLRSKQSPALIVGEAFCHLYKDGTRTALFPTDVAGNALHIASDAGEEFKTELSRVLIEQLDPSNNLFGEINDVMNKRRERGIRSAKEEAEDGGTEYAGVQFKPGVVSGNDGNPCVLVTAQVKTADGKDEFWQAVASLERAEGKFGNIKIMSPAQAVDSFKETQFYRNVNAALAEGREVVVAALTGHVVRNIKSFSDRCKEVAEGIDQKKVEFGDGPFIKSAMSGFTKSIYAITGSLHPKFPAEDYWVDDKKEVASHKFVVNPGQAEIGMRRDPGNPAGRAKPEAAVTYDVPLKMILAVKAPAPSAAPKP